MIKILDLFCDICTNDFTRNYRIMELYTTIILGEEQAMNMVWIKIIILDCTSRIPMICHGMLHIQSLLQTVQWGRGVGQFWCS